MSKQDSIGDTLWVVQSNGSLRATFGEGEAAIHATALGEIPGTNDGITIVVTRWDRVLLDDRFADLSSAMDAVARVVEDEWDEDDRLAEEMRWVALADEAESEHEVGVSANAESACAAADLVLGGR